MFYSDEFKKKVKEVYPNDKKIHEILDNGNDLLGRYLDDNCTGRISANEILNATSLDDLKEKAKYEIKKCEVYNEWGTLYKEYIFNH